MGVFGEVGVAGGVDVNGEVSVAGTVGELVVARQVDATGEVGMAEEVGVAGEVLSSSTVDGDPRCGGLYQKLQCHCNTTGWYAGSEKAHTMEFFCADHMNAEQVGCHSFCQ